MDISSLLNNYIKTNTQLPEKSNFSDKQRALYDSEKSFSNMFNDLISKNNKNNTNDNIFDNLINYNNESISASIPADYLDLDIASLTNKIQKEPQSSMETIQQLMAAYDSERMKFLNSLASYDFYNNDDQEEDADNMFSFLGNSYSNLYDLQDMGLGAGSFLG